MSLAVSFKARNVGDLIFLSVASAMIESRLAYSIVADATVDVLTLTYSALKDRAKIMSPLRGEGSPNANYKLKLVGHWRTMRMKHLIYCAAVLLIITVPTTA